MPRGGNQPPRKPAAVSGPGKLSRRTDGKPQPIREPDIDTPGLEYGDRQRLTDAQRIARAAGGQGNAPVQRMQGEASVPGKLPPWLMGMPSARPGEPTTAGLDMGAGPGSEVLQAAEAPPDIREVVLDYLARTYGNEDARALLQQFRNERAASVNAPAAPPSPVAPAAPATGQPPELDALMSTPA
jgi:hypothetical protein